MQSVSATWSTLWAAGAHCVYKAVIDTSNTITEKDILSISIYGGLFAQNTLSFGGCYSRMLKMSFVPGAISIPVMAKVQIYVQLDDGVTQSEWISKGIFYIDTRQTDAAGVMHIVAYDAMLMTEQLFSFSTSPQLMSATAAEIATAIGVTIDSRTTFDTYYCNVVTGYSMRQILGFIAVANCANWVITDDGKLRMIRADETTDNVSISDSVAFSKDIAKQISAYSKVILDISASSQKEAGTNTGLTMEMSCPWATDAMASAILSDLSAITYIPARFKTLLNPAVEIGDTVTYDSNVYIIGRSTLKAGPTSIYEIEAPGDSEVNHEYQFATSQDRNTARRLADVEAEYASLQVITGQISATVSGKLDKSGGALATFGWDLLPTGFTVNANGSPVLVIDQSGLVVNGSGTFSGTIYATAGEIGNFKIGTALYSGSHSSMSDGNNGIYIGTDGIDLTSSSGRITIDSSTSHIVARSTSNLYDGIKVIYSVGGVDMLDTALTGRGVVIKQASPSLEAKLGVSSLSSDAPTFSMSFIALSVSTSSYSIGGGTYTNGAISTFTNYVTFSDKVNVAARCASSVAGLGTGVRGDIGFVVTGW